MSGCSCSLESIYCDGLLEGSLKGGVLKVARLARRLSDEEERKGTFGSCRLKEWRYFFSSKLVFQAD